jgi:AraC-like DNA-binding protein
VDRFALMVRRHRSGWGSFQAVDGKPHPALAGLVLRYTGFREETAAALCRRHLPSAEVTLIVGFDHPLRLVEMPGARSGGGTFRSFVAGLHTRPAITEHAGRQHGVGVGLTPLGAYVLFGVPMRLLAGAVVDLPGLLGRAGSELELALAEARGWAERFALLDRVLISRMDEGPAPAPEVAWAWRRLCSTAGQVAVRELVEQVGWSHRHLVARFREQIGLAPKSAARVLRLQRSLVLLERSGDSLAEVALAAGFCDQAHLNREFRALAGCTPTEWLAARLPAGVGIAA